MFGFFIKLLIAVLVIGAFGVIGWVAWLLWACWRLANPKQCKR